MVSLCVTALQPTDLNRNIEWFIYPGYAHGLATRGVHYLHQPGPLLQHEIGQDKAYINETLFTFFFVSFILWSFHPFILDSKKIYTVEPSEVELLKFKHYVNTESDNLEWLSKLYV